MVVVDADKSSIQFGSVDKCKVPFSSLRLQSVSSFHLNRPHSGPDNAANGSSKILIWLNRSSLFWNWEWNRTLCFLTAGNRHKPLMKFYLKVILWSRVVSFLVPFCLFFWGRLVQIAFKRTLCWVISSVTPEWLLAASLSRTRGFMLLKWGLIWRFTGENVTVWKSEV